MKKPRSTDSNTHPAENAPKGPTLPLRWPLALLVMRPCLDKPWPRTRKSADIIEFQKRKLPDTQVPERVELS